MFYIIKKKMITSIIKNFIYFVTLSINIFSLLLKLKLNKFLALYILNSHDLFNNDYFGIIFIFMSYLLINSLEYSTQFLLKKKISDKLDNVFEKNIKKNIKINFLNWERMNKLLNKINETENLMKKIIIDLPKTITHIAYYFYNLMMYPKIIATIILYNLLIGILFNNFSQKKNKLEVKKNMKEMKIKKKLQEIFYNIDHVRISNKEDDEIKKILGIKRKLGEIKKKEAIFEIFINKMNTTAKDILLFIINYFGTLIMLEGKIERSDLLYLSISCNFLINNIDKLKKNMSRLIKMGQIIRSKKIFMNEINITNLIKDHNVQDNCADRPNTYDNNSNIQDAMLLGFKTQSNGNISNNISQNIKFENVCFSYDGKKKVINNVNIEFEDQKINVLLGPNGSGKTTIIKLLMRYYELDDPKINRILFKGINIKNIEKEELRKKITYVPHEVYIFDETIDYNIKYGNEDICESKILKMSELICNKEWYLENKDKRTGYLGENLSGGEKKKIQLLNKLCRDSEVIIFDEPTTTLDSEALKWFYNLIIILKEQMSKTIIIISHDLRIKDMSDKILEIANNAN